MNAWAHPMSPDPPATHERLRDPDAAQSERTYAMFIHLGLLAVHFIGVPVVVSAILWLIRKGESPFLDDHGREAVNFQISLLLYALVSGVLIFCGIGVVALIGTYVLGIVGCIMASIAAHRGEFFRYPMTIRLLG